MPARVNLKVELDGVVHRGFRRDFESRWPLIHSRPRSRTWRLVAETTQVTCLECLVLE